MFYLQVYTLCTHKNIQNQNRKYPSVKMCTNTFKMRFLEKPQAINQFEENTFCFKNYHTKKFPKPLKKFTGFQQKDPISIYLEQNRVGVVNLGFNTTVAFALLKSIFQRINKCSSLNLVKAMGSQHTLQNSELYIRRLTKYNTRVIVL